MGTREEILALVEKYYLEQFASKENDSLHALIHYAGRVFDAQELINLVDSSLDFYLTADRYARRFERRFSCRIGERHR